MLNQLLKFKEKFYHLCYLYFYFPYFCVDYVMCCMPTHTFNRIRIKILAFRKVTFTLENISFEKEYGFSYMQNVNKIITFRKEIDYKVKNHTHIYFTRYMQDINLVNHFLSPTSSCQLSFFCHQNYM